MKPYARLERGNCLDVMKRLADRGEQFDSIVTDPPYHLVSVVKRFGKEGSAPAKHGTDGLYARQSRGFMGKEWDGGDVAFRRETWELAFALLKPGGHLLAFSGTRTYHRMVVAIEDAGFEIRDQIGWLYGTGFPKSHDVSKGIDAQLGAERRVLSEGRPVKRMIPGADQDATGSWVKDNGRVYVPTETEAGSPEARTWQGWGTALKPAWEPIVVARKAVIGTVASNVLQFGTGALNIDASRIGSASRPLVVSDRRSGNNTYGDGLQGSKAVGSTDLGRWPANVIHDGSDEVEAAFAAFGERKSGSRKAGAYGVLGSDRVFGKADVGAMPELEGSAESASRFFYSAKATKEDRAGTKHPTVKPQGLMRYLVRMVTPPGGLVLDPFCGSGSTLQAAGVEGFNSIGIEMDPQSQEDTLKRLRAAGLGGSDVLDLFAEAERALDAAIRARAA